MATLLAVSVLIASGPIAAACAAYAIRRWRMPGRNAPRSRSRYLTRSRGNRRSPSPQVRVIRRTRSRRVITGTVTRRLTAPPPSTRPATAHEECVVCRDEPPIFPNDTPTPACKHRTEVCFDCLKRTIKEAVKAGRFGGDGMQVRCPSVGCNHWMKSSDIMVWADVETFDTYERLVKRFLNDGQMPLRCLNPRCNGVQKRKVNWLGSTPVVVCLKCGQRQCQEHQCIYHDGYSCRQWDKKKISVDRRNEYLSNDWVSKNTKACPGRRCGRRIQKVDGCDHITDSKTSGGCGHQFCWLCLAPWDEIRKYDNSKHYDHCKYYSGRPNGHPAPSHLRPAGGVPARKRGWLFWRRSR